MEDHYLFTLYHLIEHFIRGGIGIRMVLDIYILSGLPELDRDKTAEELKKLKIDRFEKNILDIAGKWFDPSRGLQGTGALSGLEEMEEYIVNGGVFGNSVNEQVNNALRYGGKGKFLRTVIFPSYRTMQSVFPWLNSPIQLPMAWLNRWWNVWTKRRANIRGQFERADQISDQDRIYIEKQKKFFRRYGL